MESWPQNPEFRNNPENFHLCLYTNEFVPYTWGDSLYISKGHRLTA